MTSTNTDHPANADHDGIPAADASVLSAVPHRYTAQLAAELELRWQDRWDALGTFHTPNPSGALRDGNGQTAKPGASPFYVMDMFPYPSGAGLHVGHPLGYIATDVVGRYRRMRGENVLHALGYDAFGLPAEQYAVQTGQHPQVTTEANIANMRRQLRRLGLAHDPRRTFATTDASYVRWTQWIFLQIFNAWYDDGADQDGTNDTRAPRARPIAELISQYEAGTRKTPDGRAWADLDAVQRRRIIDSQRLAYVGEAPVNWCPALGTVLANEEVTSSGRSERGNFPVFERTLRQWNMRITAYADRLSADLDLIDWPANVKTMQRKWIGRSDGAQVRFAVVGGGQVEVFTTRPDTLFGATFMVVAPEHPLLDHIPAAWPSDTRSVWTGNHDTPIDAVEAYRIEAASKTAIQRQSDTDQKTGVFTGHFAINPVNGAHIPVFTADYVLMGYGTGAIMAVPAEDERDWAFAETFELPHVRTVQPPPDFAGGAWTGPGQTINSANAELSLNGLTVEDSKPAMVTWLEAKGLGAAATTYRLRDWLFSRQRYWGEPFPIVYDEHDLPMAVPDALLPVTLPDVPDYSPRTFAPDDADSSPEPPLGRIPDWVEVTMDLGDGPKTYRRETNTMPNWAGSCWYYLRYLDPANDETIVEADLERYWLGPKHNAGGVDLYVGGVEHAVLHLLYARFWHKVLYDLGHVSSLEPFHRLFNQGYIQAFAYARQDNGAYVEAATVTERSEAPGEYFALIDGAEVPLAVEYGKMGKSLKNVVTPDDMYEAYGADTFRVYEMSMGPLDQSRPWETRAVVGSQRFLQRLWRNAVDETTGALIISDDEPDLATLRLLHRTIADVRTEMEAMRINTAISRLIVLNNHLTSLDAVPRAAIEPLVLMLAPVAPHIAEELWSKLGHAESLAYAPYPVADETYLAVDTITCVLQVHGKVRGRVEVPTTISDEALQELALADAGVQRALAGRDVRTVVVRAPKLVNVVPT